jgi:hypothetical protein
MCLKWNCLVRHAADKHPVFLRKKAIRIVLSTSISIFYDQFLKTGCRLPTFAEICGTSGLIFNHKVHKGFSQGSQSLGNKPL